MATTTKQVYIEEKKTLGDMLLEQQKKKQRKLTNISRKVSKADAIQEDQKTYMYKVMKRMDDDFLHSGSVPLDSKLHKIYKEGYKTSVSDEMFNEGFGICVFPSLEYARRWEGSNPGIREIWKVEVGVTKEANSCRLHVSDLVEMLPKDKLSKASYRKVLKIIKEKCDQASWPSKAIVTSYVIPIEKISEY